MSVSVCVCECVCMHLGFRVGGHCYVHGDYCGPVQRNEKALGFSLGLDCLCQNIDADIVFGSLDRMLSLALPKRTTGKFKAPQPAGVCICHYMICVSIPLQADEMLFLNFPHGRTVFVSIVLQDIVGSKCGRRCTLMPAAGSREELFAQDTGRK